MNKLKTISIALVLAIGAQTAGATGNVDVNHSRKSETISFADLDLDGEAGAAVLYSRLRAAAKRVCAPLQDREARRAALYRECVSEALTEAVADVNEPMLTQYSRTKGSSQPTAVVARR